MDNSKHSIYDLVHKEKYPEYHELFQEEQNFNIRMKIIIYFDGI
jgi:hypothetical protein